LDEKEWMLKEIHHRVRNNLQIVISLLNSQGNYLSDNVALSTLKESQHRMQAMALIHQRLYQSEQIAHVEMAPYINELVIYLRDSYDLSSSIKFHLAVDPVALDVTLAVPLGLIINEAITNSLKYAFPMGQNGALQLSLSRHQERSYELTIADDGVGLPPGYQPMQSCSMGMTLMHGLSDQIGGILNFSSSPQGVTMNLVFQDEQLGATYSAADLTYRWYRPTAGMVTLIPGIPAIVPRYG
jgi:two-component sensor histidine kinase